MVLDQSVEDEYWKFCSYLMESRAPLLREGEQITDRCFVESVFLYAYDKLIRELKKKPSVTEYGGAVPNMSLFLLSKQRLDKVIVVDNDDSSLNHLRHVKDLLNLPVEIVKEDVNRLSSFPDTDLAVSFNALYGPSPTFATALKPPVLKRPVIMEASYAGFGVFRSVVEKQRWNEEKEVVKQMRKKYLNCKADSFLSEKLPRMGAYKKNGVLQQIHDVDRYNLHFILGWDRKP